jgi:hypothetical protein
VNSYSRHSAFNGPWGITRALIFYVFAAATAVLAFGAARYVTAESANQSVRNLMTSIQNRRSENLERLVKSAEDLPKVEPFAGALAATRADAMAMIVYMSPSFDSVSEFEMGYDEVRGLFQRALEITPKDGYLWARYAFFLDHLSGLSQSNETSHALFQAMLNGSRDYNTVRLTSELGIKRWPWLTCSQRKRLVQILDYAESVDDQILSMWNTDLRLESLKQHLQKQYEYYEFDLEWAKRHVSRCGEN